jgi:hypothetical protein
VATFTLSTSGGTQSQPVLFRGRVSPGPLVAGLLLAVARISRTRFYTPAAMTAAAIRLADPVITSHGDHLRFESFSSCGSTYARLDLPAAALDAETAGVGTTNVDFNAGMRSALQTIVDGQQLQLEVGDTSFAVISQGTEVVERKVALPDRWVKGLSEVQLAQAGLVPHFDLGATQFLRFCQQLPRASVSAQQLSVVAAGNSLRLTRARSPEAVRLGGPHRLRPLADVVKGAQSVRVYGGPMGSAWEVDHGTARFVLVLSPDASRGFSGEGAALRHLVDGDGLAIASVLQPLLRWQRTLPVAELAAETGLASGALLQGLAALGATGELGYDLVPGTYFHRPLPFGARRIDLLAPRLRDAHRLVDEKAVFLLALPGGAGPVEAMVRSGGVEHRVTLTATAARCTCPWFSKHRGDRGPCKHELAVRLAIR